MREVLSKFADNLDSLIFDVGLDGKSFAREIGISTTAVYSYLNEHKLPSIGVAVKIADYFDCSVEFLLGREPEQRHGVFCPCPPWKEQIAFLLRYYNVTKYRLCKDVPITHSIIFAWQKGSVPNLDYVLRLADYFGCSVDFVLGREK